MSIIEWEKDQSVAIIRMNNGQNTQTLQFAKRMLQVLDEVLDDKDISAAVIASTDEKCWSAGIDLNWVMERIGSNAKQDVKDFLYAMDAVFKKLLLYPIPAIAAINGHAFGNGTIMACACDFRFMRSDRGFFCFPEVDINVPFLPGMIAFVKKAIPNDYFNELALTGKRATAPELYERHVILKACRDSDETLREALAFARTMKKGRTIFGENKKRMHAAITKIIDTENPAYIENSSFSA